MHVGDGHSWSVLKLWKSSKCATLPSYIQLIVTATALTLDDCRKLLVLVYMFDNMVWTFLALIFGRALLFIFCMHEGMCQHSVADLRMHCSIG